MNAIDRFLQTCIYNEEFPSAVYLVAEGRKVLSSNALGQSVVPCPEAPTGYKATLETIYDLASLTKPLFTGYLLLKAFQEGLLSPETAVSQILPEFSTQERRDLTIRQLATHSAGFTAWLPVYILATTPARALKAIAESEVAYAPSSRVVYSDLGYITLGALLERLYEQALPILLKKMSEELGLETATFNPPEELRPKIAASETGNIYEQGMVKDPEKYRGWRKQLIWGSVHDHNCYFLGGASGHAGLFAAARDVHRLALEFTPDSKTLEWGLLKKLVYADLTSGCDEGRSIGWLMGRGQTMADPFGQESFGHTGFTGTSIWIEPERNRIYILLTNRTHPVRKEFNMNERRRDFHRLASKIA